jgi:hypothetical protein
MSSNNNYHPQASTTVTTINHTTIPANSTAPQASTTVTTINRTTIPANSTALQTSATVTPSIRIEIPANSAVLQNMIGNINEETSTTEVRNVILEIINDDDDDIPETCVPTVASD